MSIVDDVIAQSRAYFVGHRETDLPRTRTTPAVAAKWMIDEWALRLEFTQTRLRWPSVDFRRRIRDELGDAVEMYNRRGWVDDPRSYHRDPPPIDVVSLQPARRGPLRFEVLTCDSGYEPRWDEPGSQRWRDYEANRTAHAWILRHEGEPRPWLICINGYRTGHPVVDFNTFDAMKLHHRLGLNVAFPITPLHGPRAAGRSGDRVLDGGAMNTVNTAAQGLWDIRRLKRWIVEDQGAPQVGAMGISLGGYLVSLLTCFEDDLSLVIAGVPEADLVRGMRRTVEPLLPPQYEQWGLSWRSLERINRVVSPLAMEPLVPAERLFIFAGLVDRWVRPGNVRSLWDHWDRPEICWYQGGHLSFPFEPSVRRFVDDALRRRLVDPDLAGR